MKIKTLWQMNTHLSNFFSKTELFQNRLVLLVLLISFQLTFSAFSQQVRITGIVFDSQTGETLPGVNVVLKNSKKGTITDFNGKFEINSIANSKSVIIVSYIGYNAQEIVYNGESELKIALTLSSKNLDEVVVVGYGTSKRKDLTGSVGSANTENMKKAPVASFDQALGGRIAGVTVSSNDGQPGAASQISIRGSSISQDASPLYVVDGFPIENMDINSINPNDIESIDVLKDASSIAIYGARGANGVIMITTNKSVAGSLKVTYSYSDGYQKATKKMEMMSPYQFVKLQLELDDLNGNNIYSSLYLDPTNNITIDSYKNKQGYDWQDLTLRTGRTQNHYISMSGGNSDTKYIASGSYFDQKGLIINTGLTRFTGTININQKFSKNLKGGLNIKYSNSTIYGTIPAAGNGAGNGGGVVQAMWQYRPVGGVGNPDLMGSIFDEGSMEDFMDGTSSSIGDNLVNPKIQAENEYRKKIQQSSNIGAFLEYSFWKNFKLKLSGSYGGNDQKHETFFNSKTQQGSFFVNKEGSVSNANGINGSVSNTNSKNYLNENILTYAAKFKKKHAVNALAGFTYQYQDWDQTGFSAINAPLATESYGILSLASGLATEPKFMSSRSQLFSFLGRVNYTYNDTYLFTLSGRSDGSSKFTPGKQWGYFPSGAFAWRFTQEPFMKGVNKVLSDGKLRISYGMVGNNKVGDFSYLPWSGQPSVNQGYPFNNVYLQGGGLVPYFYGNDNLTWETNKEFDLGLNLTLWDGRISIDADYYNKLSTDFLLSVTLPSLGGYSNGLNQQYQNTGLIKNEGFELTINTVNVKTKNFMWSTNFNISFNKNKILSFYDGKESISTSWGLYGAAPAWIAKVGGSISEFYGYQFDGLYQLSDFNELANGTYVLKSGVPTYASTIQPGDAKYKDLNKDGLVDEKDQSTLGSALPIHTGGLSNTLTYKNFTFDMFFQWSYGNKVLNANRAAFESTGSYFRFGNQFASYDNRWTPTNQFTDIPKARVINPKGDAGSSSTRSSSRLIEDGSYLRLKTISLSYSFPKKFTEKLRINNFTVFANAQNLFTLTNYSGMDPEVSSYKSPSGNSANSPGISNSGNTSSGIGFVYIQPSSGTPVLAQGYDYTPYPRAVTFTYGFKVTF